MDIALSGQTLGAHITGIDLAQPLSLPDYRTVLRALGEYGVLCFPGQTLDATSLRRSAAGSASSRSTSPTPSMSRAIRR